MLGHYLVTYDDAELEFPNLNYALEWCKENLGYKDKISVWHVVDGRRKLRLTIQWH